MGISILELVLQTLRNGDFIAELAYPGQKYPMLKQPVATVHLEKVDRGNTTVTVEVNVICPASLGGTACEIGALRATELLRSAGATCVQNGCSYDGIAQVYLVPILATFVASTENEEHVLGPGFSVYLDGVYYPWVTAFTASRDSEYALQYEIGNAAPTEFTFGSWEWKLELEEMIPAGTRETDVQEETFMLLLDSGHRSEQYSRCRWVSEKREFTKTGLRRVRVGVAMGREIM